MFFRVAHCRWERGSRIAKALIKGYLRRGAYVCGAPAWDPDFNTADLLMLLPIAHMNARYARHFKKNEPLR